MEEKILKCIANNKAIREICEQGYFDPYICKEFLLEDAKQAIEFYLKEN